MDLDAVSEDQPQAEEEKIKQKKHQGSSEVSRRKDAQPTTQVSRSGRLTGHPLLCSQNKAKKGRAQSRSPSFSSASTSSTGSSGSTDSSASSYKERRRRRQRKAKESSSSYSSTSSSCSCSYSYSSSCTSTSSSERWDRRRGRRSRHDGHIRYRSRSPLFNTSFAVLPPAAGSSTSPSTAYELIFHKECELKRLELALLTEKDALFRQLGINSMLNAPQTTAAIPRIAGISAGDGSLPVPMGVVHSSTPINFSSTRPGAAASEQPLLSVTAQSPALVNRVSEFSNARDSIPLTPRGASTLAAPPLPPTTTAHSTPPAPSAPSAPQEAISAEVENDLSSEGACAMAISPTPAAEVQAGAPSNQNLLEEGKAPEGAVAGTSEISVSHSEVPTASHGVVSVPPLSIVTPPPDSSNVTSSQSPLLQPLGSGLNGVVGVIDVPGSRRPESLHSSLEMKRDQAPVDSSTGRKNSSVASGEPCPRPPEVSGTSCQPWAALNNYWPHGAIDGRLPSEHTEITAASVVASGPLTSKQFHNLICSVSNPFPGEVTHAFSEGRSPLLYQNQPHRDPSFQPPRLSSPSTRGQSVVHEPVGEEPVTGYHQPNHEPLGGEHQPDASMPHSESSALQFPTLPTGPVRLCNYEEKAANKSCCAGGCCHTMGRFFSCLGSCCSYFCNSESL